MGLGWVPVLAQHAFKFQSEAYGFKMNVSLPTWLRMKFSSCPNSSSNESWKWNFYLSSFCSTGKHGRQRLLPPHSGLQGGKLGRLWFSLLAWARFCMCLQRIAHEWKCKPSTVTLSWSHDWFQWTLTLNLNYLEASTLLTPDTFREERQFKYHWRNFPGGPVAKTPHSQCRGSGFDPWSGN